MFERRILEECLEVVSYYNHLEAAFCAVFILFYLYDL